MYIAYKIVNPNLGSLLIRGNGYVTYQIDEWVTNNYGCGPLTAFKTLRKALDWVVGLGYKGYIYACYYKPAFCNQFMFLPDGTVLAEAVKLIDNYTISGWAYPDEKVLFFKKQKGTKRVKGILSHVIPERRGYAYIN